MDFKQRVFVRLLLLDVLQAVDGDSSEDDQSGEDKLQVGIHTENGEGIGQRREDQDTDDNALDLADAAAEAMPPLKEIPPTTQAAMASVSQPWP